MKIILLVLPLIAMVQFTYAEQIYEYKEKDRFQLLAEKMASEDYNPDDIATRLKVNVSIGDINKWYVACNKDKFNGLKSCYISKDYQKILILFAKGKYSVLIGSKHYPNSSSTIKIDNNPTIYGFEGTSNTPLKVIEQMKKGKMAYTRYKEWPYLLNVDREVELDGFADALEDMKRQYDGL